MLYTWTWHGGYLFFKFTWEVTTLKKVKQIKTALVQSMPLYMFVPCDHIKLIIEMRFFGCYCLGFVFQLGTVEFPFLSQWNVGAVFFDSSGVQFCFLFVISSICFSSVWYNSFISVFLQSTSNGCCCCCFCISSL